MMMAARTETELALGKWLCYTTLKQQQGHRLS